MHLSKFLYLYFNIKKTEQESIKKFVAEEMRRKEGRVGLKQLIKKIPKPKLDLPFMHVPDIKERVKDARVIPSLIEISSFTARDWGELIKSKTFEKEIYSSTVKPKLDEIKLIQSLRQPDDMWWSKCTKVAFVSDLHADSARFLSLLVINGLLHSTQISKNKSAPDLTDAIHQLLNKQAKQSSKFLHSLEFKRTP